MKVTIFGAGYVGLVTGACLADTGNQVICVDVDPEKIARLQQGEIPIYEPGLQDMVARNVESGRLSFTTDSREAVEHGLFQFIAVGTPPAEDGSADQSYVLEVARTIGKFANDYKVVVDKSTVPVGTASRVQNVINEELAKRELDIELDVVSNPEFLKEGAAVNDFMRPDRIVVGTDSEKTEALFRTLYDPFSRNRDRLIFMDIRSAELTKYAANAMLATKISFMNEIANLSEKLGADIEKVRLGIGSDPRIGYHFIYPGCGFGGSCFPKDVKAIIESASQTDTEMKLLRAVCDVNDAQKHVLFTKLNAHFEGDLKGKTIGVWGLAFKPKTDDMREAPSITLLEALWAAGATVKAYDPVASTRAAEVFGPRDDLRIVDNAMEAVSGVDALALVTEWTEFRTPDFKRMHKLMKSPVIVDGRNVFDPDMMRSHQFEYYGIGRGLSLAD
ncbi:MAG: UDP-glucose/GDP-mannose dehydrogenase family protein [Gammaproteobacteria bacterium]